MLFSLKRASEILAFQTTCVQVLFVSGVPLFRIGLSFFTISFQLNNYLPVYCNKRIKTVKSIKTIKYQRKLELCQFFKVQSHSLTQTIFENDPINFNVGHMTHLDKFLD